VFLKYLYGVGGSSFRTLQNFQSSCFLAIRALNLVINGILLKRKYQKVVVAALGHLCHDIELFSEVAQKKGVGEFMFIPIGKPANRLLYEKMKMRYRFCDEDLVGFVNTILKAPGLRKLRLNLEYSATDFEFFDNSRTPISLTQRELEITKSILLRNGWTEGQRIVCLCVRDDGFDRTRHVKSTVEELAYRNSEISLFSKSIEELVRRGYFVVRMGRESKSRLEQSLGNYYDYSSGDVYLEPVELGIFFLSEFTISTEFGVDELATLFRKPVILLNHLPVGQVRKSFLRPYSLPKQILDSSSKEILKIHQLISRDLINLWGKSEYSRNNCNYKDNHDLEILNSVKEYLEIKDEIRKSKSRLGNSQAQKLIYQDRLNQPVISSHWANGK